MEQEQKKTYEPIECHNGAPYSNLNLPDWKLEWTEGRHGQHPSPYTHCAYCGSVHFDNLRKLLADGAKLSGSDWKYGFPHKFYIGLKSGDQEKFYTEHLKDLKDPEFTEFAVLLKQHTNIEFSRDDEGRLFYRAPYYGYQKG